MGGFIWSFLRNWSEFIVKTHVFFVNCLDFFSCDEACLCHSVNWTWVDRDVYKTYRHERCNVTIVNELKRKVPNENWIEIKWTTEQHTYTASKTLHNSHVLFSYRYQCKKSLVAWQTNEQTNIFVIFILTCYKSIHFFCSMHCNYLEKRKQNERRWWNADILKPFWFYIPTCTRTNVFQAYWCLPFWTLV